MHPTLVLINQSNPFVPSARTTWFLPWRQFPNPNIEFPFSLQLQPVTACFTVGMTKKSVCLLSRRNLNPQAGLMWLLKRCESFRFSNVCGLAHRSSEYSTSIVYWGKGSRRVYFTKGYCSFHLLFDLQLLLSNQGLLADKRYDGGIHAPPDLCSVPHAD